MSRCWCWTVFAKQEEGVNPASLKDRVQHALECAIDKLSYCVFQIEKCPTSGRLHAQGYLHLKSPRRMSSIKHILQDKSAHVKKADGSDTQNQTYCTKPASRIAEGWEHGTPMAKGQGNRSDLQMVSTAVRSGSSTPEIARTYPDIYIKYASGIDKCIAALQTPRMLTDDATTFVLWGNSGVGKSRLARDCCRDLGLAYYSRDPGGLWWDGYTGQRAVVIDDFVGQIPYRDILRILDRYEYTAWIKGSSRQLVADTFFITSNIHPQAWYADEDFAPLRRRLTWVFHCTVFNMY